MLKQNKILIVGLMLLILGVSIYLSTEYKKYTITIKEKNSVACYLNNEPSEYIAVLEIPSINFSRGLTNDYDIDKNISFVPKSVMPEELGYTIIAGHSGNNDNSYFNNLDKLVLDDLIYLYYNDKKYTYKITDIYLIDKTGKLELSQDINKLVLVTCKRNTNKQIIIISNLEEKKETI